MSFTTNMQPIDSFSLSTQTVENPKQSKLHKIIQLFLSFDINPKETDEDTHQHAKLALRAFFIYMFFVSNVFIVAILSQSKHNFLITNAFEYHLINSRFPVKETWLERDV